MEDEVVRRRGWISGERFLDLLGATNLIPGPEAFFAYAVGSPALASFEVLTQAIDLD
jgi:chromate transport protein ChrA